MNLKKIWYCSKENWPGTEHEEWSDFCCDALREKINCLDISIRKLRNKDENDIEVYLLMHIEPAEKLHEIVKALLKSLS